MENGSKQDNPLCNWNELHVQDVTQYEVITISRLPNSKFVWHSYIKRCDIGSFRALWYHAERDCVDIG